MKNIRLQFGQKWDEVGTPKRTPVGTSGNADVSLENKELEEIKKATSDMSEDMRKNIRRTSKGHKQ